MKYDEDLLVELIADGELSHGEIAEQVGASRRTGWSIANGRSRPDLQQEIADTVEGYRQATIRLAAKYMQPLLLKQIKVALEGQGETARKCREFLIKTFMLAVPDQAAKAEEKAEQAAEKTAEEEKPLNPLILSRALHSLSPGLMDEICKELFGADYKDHETYQGKDAPDAETADWNRSP